MFIFRWSKFLVCLPVIVFLLVGSSAVVYADDETTSANETTSVDHIANCKKFYNYLLSEEYVDSTSYFYICYDVYYNVYRAYFSASPFWFESLHEYLTVSINDGQDIETVDYVPYYVDIADGGHRYCFGGDYILTGQNPVGYCESSDCISFSGVRFYYLDDPYSYFCRIYTDFSTSVYQNKTFYEYGLVWDWDSDSLGKFSVSFPYVYTDFVPYLKVRGTNTAKALEGVVAVELVEENSDFFQVRRITQTVGITLIRVLPAAILVLGGILSVRVLHRFGNRL